MKSGTLFERNEDQSMANVDKLDGRKGRRSDSKTEIVKADNTLNFALTAGAVGLGIALLEMEQAAAGTDSKSGLPVDEDRKSDTSVSADQVVPDIDHSRTANYAVQENLADGGLAAASGDEIRAETAAALKSEGSPETVQKASEAASALAATDDVALESTAHGMATASASAGTGPSASAVHANSGGGGTFGDAHGASSIISSTITTVAPSDGALDGAGKVLHVVEGVADSLLGDSGVLDIAPVITGAVDSLVGRDGVLGSLVGDHSGDVIAGLAGTGDAVVDGLVGQDGTLDGLVGSGGGGLLSTLIGSHQGILSGLLGTGSASAPGEATTASDSAASTQDAASTQNIVATATQVHADPGAASNMFEMAHSALQITEGVADVITPILTFVGQPIIEDDAHADTDHSTNASTHHVA